MFDYVAVNHRSLLIVTPTPTHCFILRKVKAKRTFLPEAPEAETSRHPPAMEVAPRAKLQETFITAPNSDPDGDELVHQSLISNDTDAG